MALCLSPIGSAASWNDEAANNYYGFVIYTWDENPTSWDYEIFPLAKSLGARWIQAEGPLVLSESAHWGRLVPDPAADLSDPASYNFDLLDWVGAADGEGLNVVLTLNTGNDHLGWSTYSPWVECLWVPQNLLIELPCNCLPRDWDQWYQFVYQVASHFNGVNGPEVRVFQTIGEPGNVEGQYFQGTPQQMYGGGESVLVTRYDGSTIMLPAAVVPITQLAVHDANPLARLALGAPYGGVEGTALAAVHDLYQEYSDGGFTVEEKQEIVDLANHYNLHLIQVLWWFREITFEDIEGWLFNDSNNPARRGREFIEASIEQPQYYDIYGFHLYDSEHRRYGWLGSAGISRAMAYIGDQLRDVKPAWVNGTGLWGNLYTAEQEARSAYHLIQTLVGSYAAGMVGLTYTGISDAILLPTPVSLVENRLDPDPPRARHEAAGAYSMLARIFPDPQSFELEGEIIPDPPNADVVLYRFHLNRQDLPAQGYAAVGWCIDEVPDPYNALSFDNPDCPKEIDVGPLLGLPPGTELAVYLYTGELATGGCTQDPVITFDEAPFLITWGDDTDGDCIPDVSDNCPDVENADQSDTGDMVMVDGEWLDAPDGRGDACRLDGTIFTDGFESGDTAAWSSVVP